MYLTDGLVKENGKAVRIKRRLLFAFGRGCEAAEGSIRDSWTL